MKKGDIQALHPSYCNAAEVICGEDQQAYNAHDDQDESIHTSFRCWTQAVCTAPAADHAAGQQPRRFSLHPFIVVPEPFAYTRFRTKPKSTPGT
jgi:hypothetical protein